VTWVYAAGFGLSAIPVAVYLRRRGRLPTFFDMFEMFGGPWSARVSHGTFVLMLATSLLVMLVVAWARGSCGTVPGPARSSPWR